MKEVLVSCPMPSSFVQALEELGFRVDYKPEMGNAEVREIIARYYGLIVSTPIKVTPELIDRAARLRFVGRAGSGMENIDVAYAEKKGIRCFNSPEGNRDAVAEHIIGMLLSCFDHLCRAHGEVVRGLWRREENRGRELKGKCIGIIGYGNTGSALARKLAGFEMEILAYDKYKSGFASEHVKEVALPEIFRKSDIVSLHVPLTEETRFMADRAFFQSFSKAVIVVNTSRGKVLDTEALLDAMDAGRVKGACLDVLEREDIRPGIEKEISWWPRLIAQENLLLTPHIAGWTAASKEKIASVLVEKIKMHGLHS